MKYSLASIIGAAFGFMLILGAIIMGTQNYLAFCSLEGLMIVVGGPLAVAFMSFQANNVMEALRGIGLMFMKPLATHENLNQELIKIIDWARLVKSGGLRELENKAVPEDLDDPFTRYGIAMVVSNYKPEEVRKMMETAAEGYYERDTIPARVLMAMASHAPAFGMVGTLVGMVIMLGAFKDDMSGVGQGLSVSLLATLYGVVTARMIYLPAASRITQKQESLRFRNHLLTEGLVMLVANESPRHIADRLNSFLRPESQHDIDAIPVPSQRKGVA
jgi:chemotaxis protein MotA